jgi:hypothetical protein
MLCRNREFLEQPRIICYKKTLIVLISTSFKIKIIRLTLGTADAREGEVLMY